MSKQLLSLLLFATACAAGHASRRDTCNPCNPQGATGTNPPSVGQELKSLYVDVLASVKDIHFKKRWADAMEPRADGFCCQETLDCVKVDDLNIPMCYDKFTTHYAFADGSWGSLTTGEYNAKDGSKANLVTGEYTKAGGEKGDIYAQDPSAKPNTATLSIPPQFTEAGVGSAIPATEIGGTVTPSSSATTTSGSGSAASTATGTATSGPTATASQNESAPSASSTGAAGRILVSTSTSFGISIGSVLMFAFCAV